MCLLFTACDSGQIIKASIFFSVRMGVFNQLSANSYTLLFYTYYIKTAAVRCCIRKHAYLGYFAPEQRDLRLGSPLFKLTSLHMSHV